MPRNNLNECSYLEVKDWLDKTNIVLVPIGSSEQHGPHLPLGTDTFICEKIVKRVANVANVPYVSPLAYGYTPFHFLPIESGRPGTITLRFRTYHEFLYDICRCLIHHGFNKIIFVTGHTGNIAVVDSVMRTVRDETNAMMSLFRVDSDLLEKLPQIKDILENPKEEIPGGHGSEIETSIILSVNRDLVHVDKLEKSLPHKPKWFTEKMVKEDQHTYDIEFEGVPVRVPLNNDEYSYKGHLGNPTNASKEKGDKISDAIAQILIDYTNELKTIKVQVKNREFLGKNW